jgi:flap endonuclease-1
MGVAISELIPRQPIRLADLRGQRVAVDALNVIYYFLTAIRNSKTGEPLKDRRGRVTSHLSGLLYRTVKLLEAGVQPVYVFNGQAPRFKAKTIAKRRVLRDEAQKKWKESVRKGAPVLKFAKAAVHIDAGITDGSKKLLDHLGVPWVQAPSEGEAQCASMCAQGTVFAMASQDFDSLLFGAPRVVRNLAGKRRRIFSTAGELIEGGLELVKLDDVLKSLGLSREQLVLLGLLVGTDYNEGVPGIGPHKALPIVREYQTLVDMLEDYKFPGNTNLSRVYQFFLHPPHTDVYRLEWGFPKRDQLFRFLVEDHDFSGQRVEIAVRRVEKACGRPVVAAHAGD